MNYWLMKSEPSVYGIDHLAAEATRSTGWDGVRNYQARNMLRDSMREGDLAFFYHSNCPEPGIAGIVEIVREGYPDPTAFDPEDHHYDPASDPAKPRWFQVDVRLRRRFDRVVTLERLRACPALSEMLILRRGNRLSVTPVTGQEWEAILALAEAP